jgi:hypothetical protein
VQSVSTTEERLSVKYYGSEMGVIVESVDDLAEAVDMLHTQVIDNLPESISTPYAEVLSDAMERIWKLRNAGKQAAP